MISRLKYIFPILIILISIVKIANDYYVADSDKLQNELIDLSIKEMDLLRKNQVRLAKSFESGMEGNSLEYSIFDTLQEDRKKAEVLNEIYETNFKKLNVSFLESSIKNSTKNQFENLVKEFSKTDTLLEQHFKNYNFETEFTAISSSYFVAQNKKEYYQKSVEIAFTQIYTEAIYVIFKDYLKKSVQKIAEDAIIQPSFILKPYRFKPNPNNLEFRYIFAMPFDTTKMKLKQNVNYHFDKKGYMILDPKDMNEELEVIWNSKEEEENRSMFIEFEKPKDY